MIIYPIMGIELVGRKFGATLNTRTGLLCNGKTLYLTNNAGESGRISNFSLVFPEHLFKSTNTISKISITMKMSALNFKSRAHLGISFLGKCSKQSRCSK